MEANFRVQTSVAPNAPARYPTRNDTTSRPDAQPVQPRREAAAVPPMEGIGSIPANVDILTAHPTVSTGATEELITFDIPLAFNDADITESVIARYVNDVNEALAPSFFRLSVGVHESTNRIMVQVIDTNTDEILREIPPESRLNIIARMQEFAGILFDERS